MMREVLITGVSGQDGRILSEILAKYNVKVTGTTRSSDKKSIERIKSILPTSVDLISLDVQNPANWNELLATKRFDVIFHMAAQSSVGKSFKQPFENIFNPTKATYELLEAVRLNQPRAKVVIANSTEVFGSDGNLKITEDSQKKPMSPYAVGKLNQASLASFYKNCYDMHISIAYLSNHESAYRSNQFVTMKIVKSANDIFNNKINHIKLGNLSIIRDWGWAEEYMNALVLLGGLDKPEDIIIATGVSISLLQFARGVFDYYGLTFDNHVKYDSSLLRTADPQEAHYNI